MVPLTANGGGSTSLGGIKESVVKKKFARGLDLQEREREKERSSFAGAFQPSITPVWSLT